MVYGPVYGKLHRFGASLSIHMEGIIWIFCRHEFSYPNGPRQQNLQSAKCQALVQQEDTFGQNMSHLGHNARNRTGIKCLGAATARGDLALGGPTWKLKCKYNMIPTPNTSYQCTNKPIGVSKRNLINPAPKPSIPGISMPPMPMLSARVLTFDVSASVSAGPWIGPIGSLRRSLPRSRSVPTAQHQKDNPQAVLQVCQAKVRGGWISGMHIHTPQQLHQAPSTNNDQQ